MSEKKGAGRPSKFISLFATKIPEYLKKGKTQVQIAELLEVHPNTIARWMKKNADLWLACNEAKQSADELVEAALFKRATGYEHQATKFFSYEGASWSEEYIERYPPDTAAAMFWLKNRQPKKWQEKNHTELTNPDGTLKPQVIAYLPENNRRGKKE